jgi:hypothetical protein
LEKALNFLIQPCLGQNAFSEFFFSKKTSPYTGNGISKACDFAVVSWALGLTAYSKEKI